VLVELGVAEQRHRAVLEVLDGAAVTVVARPVWGVPADGAAERPMAGPTPYAFDRSGPPRAGPNPLFSHTLRRCPARPYSRDEPHPRVGSRRRASRRAPRPEPGPTRAWPHPSRGTSEQVGRSPASAWSSACEPQASGRPVVVDALEVARDLIRHAELQEAEGHPAGLERAGAGHLSRRPRSGSWPRELGAGRLVVPRSRS
jgi:hypothetical protein